MYAQACGRHDPVRRWRLHVPPGYCRHTRWVANTRLYEQSDAEFAARLGARDRRRCAAGALRIPAAGERDGSIGSQYWDTTSKPSVNLPVYIHQSGNMTPNNYGITATQTLYNGF